jgi:hypothetical protein
MDVKLHAIMLFFSRTRRRVTYHYIKKNRWARALTTTPHIEVMLWLLYQCNNRWARAQYAIMLWLLYQCINQ